MELPDDVHEHWLEEAERMLEAHRAFYLKRKVYDVSTVGRRIRTAREVMSLTQEQLARAIGISMAHIAQIECGLKPIRGETLMRIARSLGVKDQWLLMESDEGGPPVPKGIMRKQRRMNFQQASHREKKKRQAQVELERLRGLRGPAKPRAKPREAASDPPTGAPPAT